MNDVSNTGKADDQANPADQQPARKERNDPPPAARRALAEAEARRAERAKHEQKPERELGGRGGADPARFGDWEVDGRAIDF